MEEETAILLYESKHQEKHQLALHQHPTHQILYILDGKGECVLEDEAHHVEPDSIVLIAPHTQHSIKAHSRMTVLVLEFNQNRFQQDIRTHLVQPVFYHSRMLELRLYESSEIRQLLRKMLYEQSQSDPVHQLGLRLLLSQVLYTLALMQQTDTSIDSNARRAMWLKQYIESRFFEISSMEELASRIGVSSRYMNQLFKEAYDMTPLQYLTEVRLIKVKRMLEETDREIVSICFEVGFEAVSTFYRVFKKHVGVSPNVYRKTVLGPAHAEVSSEIENIKRN